MKIGFQTKCPIRILRFRFDDEKIKIKWWNMDESELKDVKKTFLRH